MATVDKQISQNRTLTWLLLATSAQAAADLNNRPAAINPDLLEHMENSCLNNSQKGQKRADFDMEVCNFLCFGSAIWSLCQKLFLLENMCTSNCALPMSLNCVLFSFRLYIHSDIIALTSEYHLHSRSLLFTEINRC